MCLLPLPPPQSSSLSTKICYILSIPPAPFVPASPATTSAARIRDYNQISRQHSTATTRTAATTATATASFVRPSQPRQSRPPTVLCSRPRHPETTDYAIHNQTTTYPSARVVGGN
ncbi:hypothetical protein E2C01_073188 [Portunus trituberculatus]|uniref:Uncharacterized protein n=1 Tax=Portunus trituberculatus TaxID=210409 RepID=A0A5B7IDC3_PORTR|nr:hypothetical protein [Portunus trituberculatus]